MFGINKLKREVLALRYSLNSLHKTVGASTNSYVDADVFNLINKRLWKLENPPKFDGGYVYYNGVKCLAKYPVFSTNGDYFVYTYTLYKSKAIYAENINESQLKLV